MIYKDFIGMCVCVWCISAQTFTSRCIKLLDFSHSVRS